jgi:electron transport complex protein RnfA
VSTLAALGVFAALACNLVLHFGLGLRALVVEKEEQEIGKASRLAPVFEGSLIFLPVLLLWLFFTYIIGPLQLGFFRYILIFPLSVPVCTGIETLLLRLLPKKWRRQPLFRSASAFDGIVPVALFLTLHAGTNVLEAAVLAFCFALGMLLPVFILAGIRRRAWLEMVPRFLRGSPLALISLGLMSLVFASLAVLFLGALGM